MKSFFFRIEKKIFKLKFFSSNLKKSFFLIEIFFKLKFVFSKIEKKNFNKIKKFERKIKCSGLRSFTRGERIFVLLAWRLIYRFQSPCRQFLRAHLCFRSSSDCAISDKERGKNCKLLMTSYIYHTFIYIWSTILSHYLHESGGARLRGECNKATWWAGVASCYARSRLLAKWRVFSANVVCHLSLWRTVCLSPRPVLLVYDWRKKRNCPFPVHSQSASFECRTIFPCQVCTQGHALIDLIRSSHISLTSNCRINSILNFQQTSPSILNYTCEFPKLLDTTKHFLH